MLDVEHSLFPWAHRMAQSVMSFQREEGGSVVLGSTL